VTAGCARCGNCCENIVCDSYDSAVKWAADALEGVPDPGTDEGWAYWREHGCGGDDQPQDLAVRKFAEGGRTRADGDFLAAHWRTEDGEHYACDQFDPVTRECKAHESRPPVCRDYPWYGDEPSAARGPNMGLQCSYLADLPPAERPEGARPLIPLMVA
jgi:Fe-S-cluster containining protein